MSAFKDVMDADDLLRRRENSWRCLCEELGDDGTENHHGVLILFVDTEYPDNFTMACENHLRNYRESPNWSLVE